jgi:hypothetical protein
LIVVFCISLGNCKIVIHIINVIYILVVDAKVRHSLENTKKRS